MSGSYVGVDVGGTYVRAVAFENLSDIEPSQEVYETHTAGPRLYKDDLVTLIQTIHRAGDKNILGIGLGLPGVISDDKRSIESATFLPHWRDQSVVGALEDEFGCEVKMDHDQVCSALGEAIYGQADDASFALIGYGTGFGGAFIESAGEQTVVHPIQGARETEYFDAWEQDCGGAAIAQEFGKPAEDLSNSEWSIIMDRFASHLNQYLSRPEVYRKTVIFSGGIAVKQFDRLRATCDKLKSRIPFFEDVDFRPVSRGENSGAYGAVALLRDDCAVQ